MHNLSPALARLPDPIRLPPARQVIALVGGKAELHPLILQSLLAHLVRGERLGVIVGDNHLDAFALARLARARGLAPSGVLARLELSRPFTCFQLEHSVTTLAAGQVHKWSALYLLGLLDTFCDQDVRPEEALRLLQATLGQLGRLAARGLPVLVTLAPPPRESGRAAFVELVLRAVDTYWMPSPVALSAPVVRQFEMW